MRQELIRELRDQLQQERRQLLDEARGSNENLTALSEDRAAELEEEGQQDRDSMILERLEEHEQSRIADIDAALARMDAGTYGKCTSCGREIDEQRLRAMPTTTLCEACSKTAAKPRVESEEADEIIPDEGRLPPDLQNLNDEELSAHLCDLVREDGQVEMEELQIKVRRGVVYLEGAVPSEPQHAILLNILTDVAGLQDVVDRLEVQRLAWEREDRSKNESAQDITPGTVPNQEPYGGTEDVRLANEEGVDYEPPVNPPPPSDRRD
ncbi:MAG TPA: TraR/DksA C4-type zinc finger protein [Candidatus Binatia bacterium]|jgi:RNA polymerase-binding protein DksA